MEDIPEKEYDKFIEQVKARAKVIEDHLNPHGGEMPKEEREKAKRRYLTLWGHNPVETKKGTVPEPVPEHKPVSETIQDKFIREDRERREERERIAIQEKAMLQLMREKEEERIRIDEESRKQREEERNKRIENETDPEKKERLIAQLKEREEILRKKREDARERARKSNLKKRKQREENLLKALNDPKNLKTLPFSNEAEKRKYISTSIAIFGLRDEIIKKIRSDIFLLNYDEKNFKDLVKIVYTVVSFFIRYPCRETLYQAYFTTEFIFNEIETLENELRDYKIMESEKLNEFGEPFGMSTKYKIEKTEFMLKLLWEIINGLKHDKKLARIATLIGGLDIYYPEKDKQKGESDMLLEMLMNNQSTRVFSMFGSRKRSRPRKSKKRSRPMRVKKRSKRSRPRRSKPMRVKKRSKRSRPRRSKKIF